jgi:AFG3 family protein
MLPTLLRTGRRLLISTTAMRTWTLAPIRLQSSSKLPKGFDEFLNKDNKDSSSKKDNDSDEKDKKDHGKRGKKEPEVEIFGFNITPQNLLIYGLPALYLIYSLSSGRDESEITWHDFCNNYMDKGLVDHLVHCLFPTNFNFQEVANKTKVRVYLTNTSSYRPPGGRSSQMATPFFTIGSVESFERNLENAQNELGITTKNRIPVSYTQETSGFNILLQFAPTIILLGGLAWMTRNATKGKGGSGGIFGVGKSKAKLYNQEDSVKVKFKDVAGMDEAKEEIMEFVKFLKEPSIYEKLGAKIPKGAILSGPVLFLNFYPISPELEKLYWQRLPLERLECHSFLYLDLNLWKCLLVWDLLVCVTCLRMRKR